MTDVSEHLTRLREAAWADVRPRDEADQPLPVKNGRQDIQSQLIADIEERRELGVRRYGTPLQAFNGRDGLKDAFEEALDLVTYLKQVMVERDSLVEQIMVIIGPLLGRLPYNEVQEIKAEIRQILNGPTPAK